MRCGTGRRYQSSQWTGSKVRSRTRLPRRSGFSKLASGSGEATTVRLYFACYLQAEAAAAPVAIESPGGRAKGIASHWPRG